MKTPRSVVKRTCHDPQAHPYVGRALMPGLNPRPHGICSNCGNSADVMLKCGHYYCYLCYDRNRDDCNPVVQAKRRMTARAPWVWEDV